MNTFDPYKEFLNIAEYPSNLSYNDLYRVLYDICYNNNKYEIQ